RYVDNTLWPSKLTVLYLHPGMWPAWMVWVSALIFAVVTFLAIRGVRERPHLLVGWLWFVGVMVPTIGLRQAGIQAMADRFIYVPLIGLLILIVWEAAERFAHHRGKPVVAMCAVAAILIALSITTVRQTGHWRNSITLWERALAVDSRNFIAHADLAVALTEARQLDLARHHAAEAVRLLPQFVEARIQLGLISLIEKKPEEAAKHFEEAIRTRPGAPALFLNSAYDIAGRVDTAMGIAMLTTYAKLFPADLLPRIQLAGMQEVAGRAVEAVQSYRDLIAAQPDRPELLNNFAWLLATSADPAARNGAEAVRHAERACQLTEHRQAIFIGTLAAAFAEAGRFDDAIHAASEAIAVASSAGDASVVERNRQLLELYRAGKPYHKPEAR
ncbi:MAG: protein O-mannosyl-transferase, partial [Verrucomicrobiota bacterium]